MRVINKESEPTKLKKYRQKTEAVYDGPLFTPVKDQIREFLLKEQGYLCAYCMQRIHSHAMKIEHWHCQTKYPSEQLSYRNMLGVCKGNEGQAPSNQTCDTRKRDQDIDFNPSSIHDHEKIKIRYDAYGKIRSDNPSFDKQINDTLNLNVQLLQRNRKKVWDSVTKVLNRTQGKCSESTIKSLINTWCKTNDHGELLEYCDVAIYYLKKKIRSIPDR